MLQAPVGPSRRAGLAIVPLAFLVHNAEEALTIGTTLQRLSEAESRIVARAFAVPTTDQYHVALAVVTILGFALYGAARWWVPWAYALVVLQAVMAFNVIAHTVGAVALGGYAPGLLTAWLVEAPASWLVFRRVQRAHWMAPWQWQMLVPLAILVHGPVLLAFLSLVRVRS